MRIKIQKKWYNVKSTWAELTIADAQKLAEHEPPEDYLKYLKNEVDGLSPDIEMQVLAWVGEILPIISDMPTEVIESLMPTDRWVILKSLMHIVSGVYLQIPYDLPYDMPPAIILAEGKLYHVPTVRRVYNKDIYFSVVGFKTFSELLELQQLSDNIVKNAAMLCALLLRKNDDEEQLTEDEKLRRAEIFSNMTMLDFWRVFFSLMRGLEQSVNYTLLCSLRETEKVMRHHLLIQLWKKYYYWPVRRLGRLLTSGFKKVFMRH